MILFITLDRVAADFSGGFTLPGLECSSDMNSLHYVSKNYANALCSVGAVHVVIYHHSVAG